MNILTNYPTYYLHPLPRTPDGARVQFVCDECGHTETFVRLPYTDLAHVIGADHYRGECPAVRWNSPESPEHAAHREKLAARHRIR